MRPAILRTLGLFVALASSTAAWAEDAQQPSGGTGGKESIEFFERRVRPVLAEHCWACHGEKKQHGGLRLDSREGLFKGGDSGAVIDLKAAATSRLVIAIRHDDADLQMPPEPAAKLPDEAIAAITSWIAAGAPWPDDPTSKRIDPSEAGKSHWAFQPVRTPAIPAVRNTTWPQSPIDQFILARLEEQGIGPATAAERATLIRRAAFDLTGLPPSAVEVVAFVGDPSPDAFAKVVDRLLDSPRYGERWGRYWLDVARYADTKGYVRLQEERRFPFAYAYRDWVIRALNEDLPYDQFIIQQLAADQLPTSEDDRPLAALGFLTLGRRFTSNQHDIIDDRIDVVSRGLLGLTVTCARCHDHKYDPIPTADYYSLYGVFASSEDPIVPPLVVKPASDPPAQTYQQELDTRQRALDEYEPKQYAALLDEFRSRSADYLLEALKGRVPLLLALPTAPGEIRQLIVDRWIDYLERTDDRHPIFGPWHAFQKLKQSEFTVGADALVAGWNAPAAPPEQRLNSLVARRFSEHPPKSMADVARRYGELLAQVHKNWQGLHASTTAAASGALDRLSDPDEEALRQVLYAADSPLAVGMQDALGQYLYDAPINDEIVKRRNAVYQHLANTSVGPARAHTLVERPVPHDARILIRGNPTRPGQRVARQFLHVVSSGDPQPFVVGSGRLELARSIASRDNPLTARVLVNRVWAHHFGAGLVRSPSNFGLRGEAPTHPELLDYLATRFVDEGWSVKKLHRWIMLSSVYQQSSSNATAEAARDPENRLLSRMNRRRLDVESLRDSLLLAAGKLDLTTGGPSNDLLASGMNRRTVYGLIDRQSVPGMLPTFDFASPDTHSPERYTSTVPQQALFLMNSPMLVELAKSLAARADVATVDDPSNRFARMVQIAWGRAPTERETRLALEYLERDKNLAAAGESLVGWDALAQALLMANEFTYVD